MAAAKAAGMRCIALPPPELRHDPRYRGADAVVDSLLCIDADLLQSLGGDGAGRKPAEGRNSTIDDPPWTMDN